MKRLVTFSIEEDGRKRVQSISAPLDESEVVLDDGMMEYCAFIDANYTDPAAIEGKKLELFYNDKTGLVEPVYSDITYDDLSPIEKIAALKEENDTLKSDLELTQAAIFEVYEASLS